MANLKRCFKCKAEFIPSSVHHLFCSARCCASYNAGKSWDAFFKKLIQKSVERKDLTVADLVKILEEQNGLCALSGVTLTRITGHGNISTNASIDRINAGGPYTIDNIRLVCSCINSFRGNLNDEEFKFWCKRVANNGSV